MRLILDTNIWSEIGRRDSRESLEKLAASRQWAVQTPPATLLEVLRTPDDDALRKIVEVLSSKSWTRLRTEADQQAAEMVSEVRRTRPEWVLQLPLPGSLATYRTEWLKTVWRQARSHPEMMRALSHRVHAPLQEAALKNYEENRTRRLATKSDVSDLTHMVVEPTDNSSAEYVAGWRTGDKLEWWRVQARDVYWHSIRTATAVRRSGRNSTDVDWLEPYLDMRRVGASAEEFSKFWFYDVDRVNVPRTWLRWAVSTAQLMSKITSGSPGDDQLAAYLPDCDIFVTRDKRLASALELVRKHSLCPIPEVVRFPKLAESGSAVAALADCIR
ncbi:type II toxin-antitoxin system VapC family toxin [Actinomycetospora sp. CA-101289]|uniref:type II toxin-antitoxin system VapC family toxin n=1 Tax=Actinomycetospora sp. CA-101289 TaxID=3239893 RepID=UPI003D98CE4F